MLFFEQQGAFAPCRYSSSFSITIRVTVTRFRIAAIRLILLVRLVGLFAAFLFVFLPTSNMLRAFQKIQKIEHLISPLSGKRNAAIFIDDYRFLYSFQPVRIQDVST